MKIKINDKEFYSIDLDNDSEIALDELESILSRLRQLKKLGDFDELRPRGIEVKKEDRVIRKRFFQPYEQFYGNYNLAMEFINIHENEREKLWEYLESKGFIFKSKGQFINVVKYLKDNIKIKWNI